MEILLVISAAYIISFIAGYFVEKFRIPWVFSALFVGILLSLFGIESEVLDVLGYVGMMLMLFNIGLELDINEIRRASRFIIRSTLFIILSEALVGALLIHYLFGYDPLVSVLVALSFATVGEAVLLPILEEFRMVTSRIGEFIIGVGILDDVIELLVIVLLSLILGRAAGHGTGTLGIYLVGLFLLFFLVAVIRLAKRLHVRLPYPRLGAYIPLAFSVFFLFLGVGSLVEMDALAAILAGISLRMFLKPSVLREMTEEVRTVTYGFFAPLFFLWVGLSIDLSYLSRDLLAAVLVTLVAAATKIVSTLLSTRGYLTTREAVVAGVGLCVRFSTSIVVLKMLFDAGIIGEDLYSTLVASTALFTLIVPFAFSWLLRRHAVINLSRLEV